MRLCFEWGIEVLRADKSNVEWGIEVLRAEKSNVLMLLQYER